MAPTVDSHPGRPGNGIADVIDQCDSESGQGISGIGLHMFGLGLSSLCSMFWVGTVKTITGFPPSKYRCWEIFP
jgi:hypothetical protein